MKVLISAFVGNRREGGVAGVAYGVGHGLEQLGHVVEYLFAGDLPTSPRIPARFRELEFAVELARFLMRNPNRYSVVNLHAPNGCVYGPLQRILPAVKKNGPAYVMTLHGLEERRIYGMSREAKKGKAYNFSLRNRVWHRLYHLPRYYLSIKTADHALCVGRETWTLMQLKYNLDPDQVSYAPNGVDGRFFVSREVSSAAYARLLYAGTFLDQRGIFYLRDAIRGLVKRSHKFRLTIAGCGSDAGEVLNFFGPELQPFLDVRAMVPHDQMPHLLADNDIFVFPSIVEGTPLAVQEAMAAGMAVITTETCGMIDLVENEFNGLLIPQANSEALENAIVRLALDTELRANLGRSAQATMRRFTWLRTARIVEAAYAHALRRRGREADFHTGTSPGHSIPLPPRKIYRA
jgi:glycosyltransferase involved in cell wall biosynthesis